LLSKVLLSRDQAPDSVFEWSKMPSSIMHGQARTFVQPNFENVGSAGDEQFYQKVIIDLVTGQVVENKFNSL
jgi:hypothetical protein